MQNDDQVTNNPTKLDANLQKTVNSAISLKKKISKREENLKWLYSLIVCRRLTSFIFKLEISFQNSFVH